MSAIAIENVSRKGVPVSDEEILYSDAEIEEAIKSNIVDGKEALVSEAEVQSEVESASVSNEEEEDLFMHSQAQIKVVSEGELESAVESVSISSSKDHLSDSTPKSVFPRTGYGASVERNLENNETFAVKEPPADDLLNNAEKENNPEQPQRTAPKILVKQRSRKNGNKNIPELKEPPHMKRKIKKSIVPMYRYGHF